jgi:hypothetical protein
MFYENNRPVWLHSSDPTDVQAEVLVSEIIPKKFFIDIVLQSDDFRDIITPMAELYDMYFQLIPSYFDDRDNVRMRSS